MFTPGELKRDTEYVFRTIEKVHPNMFAYVSREDFTKEKQSLFLRIKQPMTRGKFLEYLAPTVAALRSDHTYFLPPLDKYKEYLVSGGKVFPLSLRSDGARVFLAEEALTPALHANAELQTINGLSAIEIVKRYARGIAREGREANLEGALRVVMNPEVFRLYMWFEFGPRESWNIGAIGDDGQLRTCEIQGITADELKSRGSAASGNADYDCSYRSSVAIIKLGKMYGRSQAQQFQEYTRFLKRAFREMSERKTSHLIIDVRDNPGGDSRAGNELLKYLTDKPFRQFEKMSLKVSAYVFGNDLNPSRAPDELKNTKPGSIVEYDLPLVALAPNPFRFSGRVFVLTSPATASSASSFACAVKHFKIGIIVGEEPWGWASGYGDSLRFVLPETELEFRVPCKHFVAPGGAPDASAVLPDYEVKQKPDDTRRGIDTVMEFALKLADTDQNAK